MSTASFWDARFQQEQYVYGEAPNAFLRDNARVFAPGADVLSLGEGEGRNAVYLAEQGYRVTALDSSSAAMDKLGQLAGRRGVEVRTLLADVASAELGTQSWDGIVNVFCHLPSGDRAGLLARIREALRPGGVFLTEQFSLEQLAYASGGPKDPDMLVTLAEFEEAFRGWDILASAQEVVTLDEGPFHQGPGSVIRFIARKAL